LFIIGYGTRIVKGSNMIDMSCREAVALVELNRDVTNALSQELVSELAETLEKVRAAPEVRALVLSSANEKFFSIGWDLPRLYDLPEESFRRFYELFNRTCMALYTLPKPTVACLRGHAVAGGCILALCCDYRVMAAGRKLMGLNEIKLGVPVPYAADCILQSIVGSREARDIVESGEFYEAEVSLAKGLVDEVIPLDEVTARAMERASVLGAMPPEAYAGIKANRVETVEARIMAGWKKKQREFIEMWYTEEPRKRLREAMEKF
jgi:enoyl-CoA hydratase/carnithine racemase